MDAWTRKEHFNLLKLHEAEIPCPEPILYEKNVLLMRMIGSYSRPTSAGSIGRYGTCQISLFLSISACIPLLIAS